jgi:TonB family protein
MRLTSTRPAAARQDRPLARTVAALALSALANAAVVGVLDAAGAFQLPRSRAAHVAIAALGAERWEANRRAVASADAAAASPSPAAPLLPSAQPAAPARPDGRIVRVAPSPDQRRPERARFLAERDNTVARETQRRGPALPGAGLAARPTVGAAGAHGVPLPGEEGASDEAAPGKEGARAADAPEERIERARLALAGGHDPGPGRVRTAARAGDGGARRAGRFDPRILPVADAFTAAGGGAPASERLPGVAAGDATLVNTRAFRYAAFYQRVREAIAGEWDPNRAWDARDPHDRILGRATRKVLVDIVLDPEGQLREARLVRGSGIDFFDRECLRAIAEAAPFPNPPRGLVGADGLVVLGGWGLVFEWGPEALLERLLPGR